MINQHQTLQMGRSYQDTGGDSFGGQLDCKILANLLKRVVLSQTLVFQRERMSYNVVPLKSLFNLDQLDVNF